MAKLLSDSKYAVKGRLVAVDNAGRHPIVIDAGIPLIVKLLQHKPIQTREIKLNSWVTLWPVPPTHGIILGKV